MSSGSVTEIILLYSDGEEDGGDSPWLMEGRGPWKRQGQALLLFVQEQPVEKGQEMALHVSVTATSS